VFLPEAAGDRPLHVVCPHKDALRHIRNISSGHQRQYEGGGRGRSYGPQCEEGVFSEVRRAPVGSS
jgi:hypothetical protein